MREAALADLDQVITLCTGLGLGAPSDHERIRRRWEWVWEHNPAQTMDRTRLARGWVLESGGRIVGFFGNIPRRYWLGRRELLAAVASSWAVERDFRAHTDLLARAYFNQAGADLLLVTTAIAPTARIFSRYGGRPLPQPSFGQVLFWILDEAGFAAATLRKKDFIARLAVPTGAILGPALAAVNALQQRRIRAPGQQFTIETTALSEVGQDFDDLWERKQSETERLWAGRTAEDLRWHFALGAEQDRVRLLTCRRAGRLDGYLALRRDDAPKFGLKRAKIADLVAAADDPDVMDALLFAADQSARADGCHVLELIGLPATVRACALRFHPFTRAYPSFPFHYKPLAPGLETPLAREDAWYPSMYDGDSSL